MELSIALAGLICFFHKEEHIQLFVPPPDFLDMCSSLTLPFKWISFLNVIGRIQEKSIRNMMNQTTFNQHHHFQSTLSFPIFSSLVGVWAPIKTQPIQPQVEETHHGIFTTKLQAQNTSSRSPQSLARRWFPQIHRFVKRTSLHARCGAFFFCKRNELDFPPQKETHTHTHKKKKRRHI